VLFQSSRGVDPIVSILDSTLFTHHWFLLDLSFHDALLEFLYLNLLDGGHTGVVVFLPTLFVLLDVPIDLSVDVFSIHS